MPGSRWRARAVSLLATLSLALVGVPAAVSADGAISHSGQYGVHMLVDSLANPGGTCTYAAPETLKSIRMRWPHVEGFNRTAGRDYQKVSYRFQVWRDTGVTFAVYATTPLIYAHTYDDEAASWPSQTYTFPSGAPEGEYTVHLQMYWYKSNGTVGGTAIHHPDFLKQVYNGPVIYDSSCPFEH